MLIVFGFHKSSYQMSVVEVFVVGFSWEVSRGYYYVTLLEEWAFRSFESCCAVGKGSYWEFVVIDEAEKRREYGFRGFCRGNSVGIQVIKISSAWVGWLEWRLVWDVIGGRDIVFSEFYNYCKCKRFVKILLLEYIR